MRFSSLAEYNKHVRQRVCYPEMVRVPAQLMLKDKAGAQQPNKRKTKRTVRKDEQDRDDTKDTTINLRHQEVST